MGDVAYRRCNITFNFYFSCAKDCPSIPGLTDFSPEELR